jgi:di/tricarboxylate transporter
LLFFVEQFDLDAIWTYVFGVPSGPGTSQVSAATHLSGKLEFCVEAAAILLAVVRTMLSMVEFVSFSLRIGD